MGRIALVILFNHRYEKNIEKLKRIYKERFSDVFFAIPFYKDNDENVITIYETSMSFQNYVPYIYDYLEKRNYDYYLFVADDMILNPNINEENVTSFFKVDEETSFISPIVTMADMVNDWPLRMYFETKEKFESPFSGVNYKSELPTPEEASEIAKNKGFQKATEPIRYKLSGNKFYYRNNLTFIRKYPNYYRLMKKGKFCFPYPMLNGVSDIFMVSKKIMPTFAKFCGVFGALNIHVETALPTALMLASTRIVSPNEEDIILHGNDGMWREQFHSKLNNLYKEWKKKMLYIHPVKLSGWEV